VRRGRFITFEGGEGTGKSTQARILAERLAPIVGEVVQTREPGGSPGAEHLRSLLLQGDAERWSPVSETLLMYAARADHLERLIRPSLERGAWVVCDRFYDSTWAYQGAGGGVSVRLLESLQRHVVGDDKPGLTLILDLPVDQGLARAQGRNMFDRFEAMDRAFHEKLRQGFMEIAQANPDRCVVVDASGDVQTVAGAIWSAVADRLAVKAA
jgi:dTMP kinase